MSEAEAVPLSRDDANRRVLATDHLMANLSQRTISGAAIAFVAQGLRMTLQLANAAIMARLLAPEDFGLVAMAMTVTGFVGVFTDLGLSTATVQREDVDQDTVSALLFINLGIGMGLMLAAWAVAPPAAWFFNDPRLTSIIMAMAVTIPLAAAAAQHNALLSRRMQWMTIQWTSVLAQLVGVIVGVLVATQTDLGYWALVMNGWATGITAAALAWLVCPWRPSIVRSWTGARSALTFGLNLTGVHIVNYFHRQFDNVLIGWRWGSIELGFYTRAYTLLLLPINIINGPIGSSVVPALSRLQSQPKQWRKAFLRAMTFTSLGGCALGSILIVTAQSLVLLLLGPGWQEFASIFQILAISIFFITPMKVVSWKYVSLGRTQRLLRWAVISTPVIVLGFIVGVPFGAMGIAYCYVGSVILLYVPCLWFASSKQYSSLQDMLKVSIPFIIIGAISSIVAIALVSGSSLASQSWLQLVGILTLQSSIVCVVYIMGALLHFSLTKTLGAWRPKFGE